MPNILLNFFLPKIIIKLSYLNCVKSYTIKSLSDQALLIQWDDEDVISVHQYVMAYHNHLRKNSFIGYIESVPAYTSLAVYYDVFKIRESHPSAKEFVIEQLMSIHFTDLKTQTGKLFTIPVHYGGADGPDLEDVAKTNGISSEELIRLHTSTEYHVYMIGFMPGFPYLGFTHEKLWAQRKKSPRLKVPAGSVALAGNQTGIYPASVPGGWQIIGRTTMHLFDADQQQPCLLQTGDRVKFIAAT